MGEGGAGGEDPAAMTGGTATARAGRRLHPAETVITDRQRVVMPTEPDVPAAKMDFHDCV